MILSSLRSNRWAAALLALSLFGARPALATEPQAPADDAALHALIEAAGDTDSNGGAGVVTVLDRTDVTVEESGLSWIRSWKVLKCLSEEGAAELARLRLDFDPASNTVQVDALRVIRADGTVQALDARGVDLPQPQWGIYWGAQMKLLAVPRLQPGDAVEVRSTTRGFLIAYLDGDANPWGVPDAAPVPAAVPAAAPVPAAEDPDARYIPPMRGHFYDVVYFQGHHPVKQRHYTVRTPLARPLQYEVTNGEVQAYVTFDGTHNVYSFWKTDLDAYEEEGPSAVEFPDVATKVVMATVPDWQSKSRWFAEVNEAQFEATPEVKALVAEVTAGLTTDDAKISALNHWAADNIRYSGISMGKGEGYTLHSGAMTLRDRSGVCKDKASMSITLLRAAGFTVYPAMTMAGARVERVPADQFNHCVVALRQDDEWRMLDPTWVVLSPEEWSSAEGEQHYVIGTPEGETLTMTPAFLPEDNKLVERVEAELLADGTLVGRVTFSGLGYAEQRLRRELVHTTTTPDRQAWFEEALSHLGPTIEVEPVAVRYAAIQDVHTPIAYTARFRVPGYAVLTEDGLVLAPPMAAHLISRLAPYLTVAGEDERTQGLLLWAPRMREVQATLTLPAGFKVARLPEDRHIDHPLASLSTHLEQKGKKLVYTQDLRVKRRMIPPDGYGDFKEVVDAALELPADPIVLVRR